MQVIYFFLDKISKLLTYHMPFYHKPLQSYQCSKMYGFYWPTLYMLVRRSAIQSYIPPSQAVGLGD